MRFAHSFRMAGAILCASQFFILGAAHAQPAWRPERPVEIIDRVAPMSAALQRMHDLCTTSHYIQVDEDMLLFPHAVETLERAIRFQSIAATLGSPLPIPPEDAEVLLPFKYQEIFLDEYWAAWERRVERARTRPGGSA